MVRPALGTEEFCKVIERRGKVNLSFLEQLDTGVGQIYVCDLIYFYADIFKDILIRIMPSGATVFRNLLIQQFLMSNKKLIYFYFVNTALKALI